MPLSEDRILVLNVLKMFHYLEKKLMGMAALLLTFPPSRNGIFGLTPHFITLTMEVSIETSMH